MRRNASRRARLGNRNVRRAAQLRGGCERGRANARHFQGFGTNLHSACEPTRDSVRAALPTVPAAPMAAANRIPPRFHTRQTYCLPAARSAQSILQSMCGQLRVSACRVQGWHSRGVGSVSLNPESVRAGRTVGDAGTEVAACQPRGRCALAVGSVRVERRVVPTSLDKYLRRKRGSHLTAPFGGAMRAATLRRGPAMRTDARQSGRWAGKGDDRDVPEDFAAIDATNRHSDESTH